LRGRRLMKARVRLLFGGLQPHAAVSVGSARTFGAKRLQGLGKDLA
jgi:hypothetical protein